MSIPTQGETFARLLEHIRLAQEDAAMMAHLKNADSGPKDRQLALGWLAIAENLDKMTKVVTQMAVARMQ